MEHFLDLSDLNRQLARRRAQRRRGRLAILAGFSLLAILIGFAFGAVAAQLTSSGLGLFCLLVAAGLWAAGHLLSNLKS